MKNEILEKLNCPIKCQYLISESSTNKKYCKYITNRMGRLYPVNQTMCNIMCENSGPKDGRKITTEQEKDFLQIAWKRFSPILSNTLAQKVLINYSLPVDVYIPEIVNDVRRDLEFLKNKKGFKKFLFTGSCIIKNTKKPPKDLDIALWFNDIEALVYQDLLSTLPKTIGGINVDYFICVGEEDVFPNLYFTCLDVDEKILYMSKWFKLNIRSLEEGITISDCSYEYFDDLLKSMLTETEKHSTKLKSLWKGVLPSWEKADQFIQSISSRGVISTLLDVSKVNSDAGEKVSIEVFDERKTSCFGDASKNIRKCKFLNQTQSESFCGACGCGQNKLARIDSEYTGSYSKLHYPTLQCPLGKRGFSNEKSYLSVIITTLNEDNFILNRTIRTIRENSNNVEIIVVDDCSDFSVQIEDSEVQLFRNSKRVGCAPSREFGASKAKNEYLLFTDSHMIYHSDWYDHFLNYISMMKDNTLLCGTCLGLDKDHDSLENSVGKYCGARLSLYSESNILEGKWISEKQSDFYELSCVMGAIYLIKKDFFFKLRGFSELKMWGSDEPCLSMKVILSGGEIRMAKELKAGHIFRDVAPYTTDIKYLVYNKIRMAKSLLPESWADELINKLPKDRNFLEAMNLIEQDSDEIEEYRKYYQSIFVNSWDSVLQKFDIKL